MHADNNKRNFILLIVGIIITIGLTGCFKADVSIDVKQNGSGLISFTFGMTQQAKAFLASEGTDPLQDINKSLADASNTAKDVKITTWIDGEYEWTRAEKEFANLDELNKSLNDKKLFNHFSLTRNRSLLRDEFILNAELAPFDSSTSGNNSGVDPAAFIQMSFSVRLPGKIIETNGLRDINDPNRIVWSMASNRSVSIRAASAAWNWTAIFVISGFLLFLGVVVVGCVGYIVYARSRKNKKVEPLEVEPPKQQAPPLIAEPKKPQANKQLYTLAAVVVILLSCGLLFAARAYQTSQATRATHTPTPEKISTGVNSVVFSTHTAEPSDTPRPTSMITDTATSPLSEILTVTVEPATQTAKAVNQVVTPLLEDDFSNSTNGWGTGTDADSSVEYAHNALQMIVFTKNYFVWSTPNDQAYQNVHMEVTAINNDTDSTTAFGIMCNQQASAENSFYYLAMTPAGEYSIAKATAGESDIFLTNNNQWASSDLIATDAASYRIGADCGNGTLTLYVDGQQIASVSDATYTGGGVALFTWSGENATTTNVSFDDFLMTELH